MGYNPNIPHLYVGYNRCTIHLLTSKGTSKFPFEAKKHPSAQQAKRLITQEVSKFKCWQVHFGLGKGPHGKTNLVQIWTEQLAESDGKWCVSFTISDLRLDFILIHTPGSSNIAGWKMDPDWVDAFPIKTRDIPASYVSLPEGILFSSFSSVIYSG